MAVGAGSVLTMTACGGSVGQLVGGSVGDNPWTLEGVSPDGRHLLVSTFFGGVASDCARFEGWEVVETADGVDVRARLWERRAPSDCTSDGASETHQIDLGAPLDDRPLTGCGTEDCRATVAAGGNGSIGRVLAGADTIIVTDNRLLSRRLHVYDADGIQLTTIDTVSSGDLHLADDGTMIRFDLGPAGQPESVAIDPRTGREQWRTVGVPIGTVANLVLLCGAGDNPGPPEFEGTGLTAVDLATGANAWTAAVTCGPVVAHGELLTIVSHDPLVDGGHRLAVVDAATGAVARDEPFDDGVDDQVTGFDRAIALDATTVVSGTQADVVVLSPDGTELDRRRSRLGFPLGQADGVAVIARHDRVTGYDPTTDTELWTVILEPHRGGTADTIAVAGESVVQLDPGAGTVSRLDPRTGEARWTTEVGLTSGFAADSQNGVIHVATTLALVALDDATGELLWSVHRSPTGDS